MNRVVARASLCGRRGTTVGGEVDWRFAKASPNMRGRQLHVQLAGNFILEGYIVPGPELNV